GQGRGGGTRGRRGAARDLDDIAVSGLADSLIARVVKQRDLLQALDEHCQSISARVCPVPPSCPKDRCASVAARRDPPGWRRNFGSAGPRVLPLPTNDELGLIRHRPAPQHGWRKLIHRASGGVINPGESERDIFLKALIERVNQPVHGDYSIAVLSMKGGVG